MYFLFMYSFFIHFLLKVSPFSRFNRLVYKWFYLIHKGTTALSLIGYFIIMLTLFGVSLMFRINPDTAAEVGLLVLFYGLYFGVLGRDFAEICADKMASKLGVSVEFILYKKSIKVLVIRCGSTDGPVNSQ